MSNEAPRFGDEEIAEVVAEAEYAAGKWSEQFDEANTLNDWVNYACMYATAATKIQLLEQPMEVYAKLIKAANLCLLAAARVRTNTIAPRHYDTLLGITDYQGDRVPFWEVVWDEDQNQNGVDVAGEDLEQGDLLVRAADSAMRIEEARYTEADISDEQTRMYEFGTGADRYRHVIVEPRTLVFRHGGSTHRVIDSKGVVHCVPAPGHQACVLTWYPKDPSNPIQF